MGWWSGGSRCCLCVRIMCWSEEREIGNFCCVISFRSLYTHLADGKHAQSMLDDVIPRQRVATFSSMESLFMSYVQALGHSQLATRVAWESEHVVFLLDNDSRDFASSNVRRYVLSRALTRYLKLKWKFSIVFVTLVDNVRIRWIIQMLEREKFCDPLVIDLPSQKM